MYKLTKKKNKNIFELFSEKFQENAKGCRDRLVGHPCYVPSKTYLEW
jgi:hypothetical protein